MNSEDIDLWRAPEWHPDFGDPQKELDMLVSFCKRLISNNKNIVVNLNDIEPGYLAVDLSDSSGNQLGELYIVDDDGVFKYGLFYDLDDEKEMYFTDPDEGIKYIAS